MLATNEALFNHEVCDKMLFSGFTGFKSNQRVKRTK